ncbi:DUF4296 domain-containing protein [Aureitalea marina]|uniref:DUF4296 domain-containing protein n=1 Tax=Aureitalea marina TaxID=930804 RepID=A0A2S7KT79_9FLAO|nr:DUF4296 domain-containing protein [Aureitalea marina]PQB05830.1 hypothetical protein BST85_13675 [Aureitalea marina]
MNKNIWIVLIFLIGLGCQHIERPKMPENLIPRDKMINILTDLYINNAARSVNVRVLRNNGIVLDSLLYVKYDIDSLQFTRSNAYYTSDLDNYNSMFEEIEQRLVAMKSRYDSLAKDRSGGSTNMDSVVRAQRINQQRGGRQLVEPASTKVDQDSLE